MSSIQAVCVGVITVDTIALVDRYPSEDERVIAHEIVRGGGGPAAVAAVALSRLGIKTAIIGTIGDDADEKMLQKFLNNPDQKVFQAQDSRDIKKFFKYVTMSVSLRTRSKNPETMIIPDMDDIDNIKF